MSHAPEVSEVRVCRREERQARGEEADSDLEDDDIEESPEDTGEKHHNLLSCMSLSKMVVDYGKEHQGSNPARALKALITNVTDVFEADEWTLNQVRCLACFAPKRVFSWSWLIDLGAAVSGLEAAVFSPLIG